MRIPYSLVNTGNQLSTPVTSSYAWSSSRSIYRHVIQEGWFGRHVGVGELSRGMKLVVQQHGWPYEPQSKLNLLRTTMFARKTVQPKVKAGIILSRARSVSTIRQLDRTSNWLRMRSQETAEIGGSLRSVTVKQLSVPSEVAPVAPRRVARSLSSRRGNAIVHRPGTNSMGAVRPTIRVSVPEPPQLEVNLHMNSAPRSPIARYRTIERHLRTEKAYVD